MEELDAYIERKIEEKNKVHIFPDVSLNVSNGNATFNHNLGIKGDYIAFVLPTATLIPSVSKTQNGENTCSFTIYWSSNMESYSGTYSFCIVIMEL